MIWLDTNEPLALQLLLEQGNTVERHPLNTLGFADILWHGLSDTQQMERKQAPELLSSLDSVEEQLHRQILLGVADKLRLVVEGMIAPSADGVVTYQMSKDSKVMYKTRTFHRPYTSVMSWFSALEANGVEVYCVPSLEATALLVSALYHRSQKLPEEQSTFSKYIKPRPQVSAYNPFVLTLMGIENGGVGEEMGKALVARFRTPWEVFCAGQQEIADTRLIGKEDKPSTRRVGPATALKLHKAIGRE